MLPSNSLKPCLDSPPGYYTEEFHALQLIVFLFGAIDKPSASFVLVYFLEI